MWAQIQNKLTEPERDEGSTESDSGSLWESLNPIRKLRVPPAKPFSQLSLYGILLGRKLSITRVCIAENIDQQLVGHILQSHGDLTARKEKGVSGTTPPANQMAKIEQVTVVGQAPRKDYGFQHAGPL